MGWIKGLLYQWEIFSAELSLYFQEVSVDPGFVLQRIHRLVSLSLSLYKNINSQTGPGLT